MIKPVRTQKTTNIMIDKTPEPTKNRNSTTPVKSMIYHRKKIIIGPIETIYVKNKTDKNKKIHQQLQIKETNQNLGSINLPVNNSFQEIFNEVNKSSLTNIADSFAGALKGISNQKPIYYSKPIVNTIPKQTLLINNQQTDLTKAGNGCKLVSSLQFEEQYSPRNIKIQQSFAQSLLLQSFQRN